MESFRLKMMNFIPLQGPKSNCRNGLVLSVFFSVVSFTLTSNHDRASALL